MSWAIWTYLLYLAAAVYITVVVGHQLHKHGRVFIIACFAGRVSLADALNDLLLVCYYLVNMGLLALLLKDRIHPQSGQEMFELLSSKLGLVLLILGVLHAGNMFFLRLSWWKFHDQGKPLT